MTAPLIAGVDMSILRHPHAGSARWAIGLYRAIQRVPDIRLEGWVGPQRMRRGGVLRKGMNLIRERAWYDISIPRLAARTSADVLLMPVNLSARAGRIPQVVSILDVNFLTQPGTYDRLYTVYAARMFARSANDADVLTTISEYSRDEIARQFGVAQSRIHVVYPGLNAAPLLENRPSPRGRPYALYVGATEPHKNIDLLFSAWAGGSPAGLDLVIVGNPGRDHERLCRRAAQLDGRARIVGRVSDSVLDRWYHDAAVFLFPSRTEGFGFPPLEAMQRGIPVVAAAAGALPEVLRDAALFHDPDDGETLRGLIESLQKDQCLRAIQVARGHAVAGGYTWDATAQAMASLLRSAASR